MWYSTKDYKNKLEVKKKDKQYHINKGLTRPFWHFNPHGVKGNYHIPLATFRWIGKIKIILDSESDSSAAHFLLWPIGMHNFFVIILVEIIRFSGEWIRKIQIILDSESDSSEAHFLLWPIGIHKFFVILLVEIPGSSGEVNKIFREWFPHRPMPVVLEQIPLRLYVMSTPVHPFHWITKCIVCSWQQWSTAFET